MRASLKTSEGELIRRIGERAARQRPSAGGLLKLSIGDDCAILRPRRGEEIVVTTDLTLENTHFRYGWHPPESVGYRSLARGLSDIAAMGAHPEAAFLSIAVPADLTGLWLDRFLDGWMLAAKRYSVALAGGDTAESPRPEGSARGLFTADVVLLGSVLAGRALRRSGARAGDILYVTGGLGGAAAQLRAISPRAISAKAAGVGPHFYPEPRLKTGAKLLASRLATAAIDLSDGLSTDLSHLCEASRLRAVVDQEALPIAPGATLEDALHGGEDYELLFTARPAAMIPARLGGAPVRPIGQMLEQAPGRIVGPASRRILGRRLAEGDSAPAIQLRAADGRSTPLSPRGWEHFRSTPSKRKPGSRARS